jgi:hypothetical protein
MLGFGLDLDLCRYRMVYRARSSNPGRRLPHLQTLPYQLWGPPILHLNEQSSRSVAFTSDLHLAPRLRLRGGWLPLLTLHGGCRTNFNFTGIVSLDDLVCSCTPLSSFLARLRDR